MVLVADPRVPVGYRVGEMKVTAADVFAACGDAARAEALRAEGRAQWSAAWRAGDTPVPHHVWLRQSPHGAGA
jgi:hypothetical protein